jgi:hypothetical protein
LVSDSSITAAALHRILTCFPVNDSFLLCIIPILAAKVNSGRIFSGENLRLWVPVHFSGNPLSLTKAVPKLILQEAY